MSSTQQGLNKFKDAMEAFLYNFKVMRQSFDMLQMALNAMKDIDIEELDLYLTNDSTNESHPVMRQPAIATTESPKVGRPGKYTTEEERREAHRQASKKYYEKRKAKLQALEEEVQRLKNELDHEPK